MPINMRRRDPEEMARLFQGWVKGLIDGRMQARRLDRGAVIAKLRDYFEGGIRVALESLRRIEAGDQSYATLDERDKVIAFSEELLFIERGRLAALEQLANQSE